MMLIKLFYKHDRVIRAASRQTVLVITLDIWRFVAWNVLQRKHGEWAHIALTTFSLSEHVAERVAEHVAFWNLNFYRAILD